MDFEVLVFSAQVAFNDSNPICYQKISLPQKGKKKLLLSGLSTPKNKTLNGGLSKQ